MDNLEKRIMLIMKNLIQMEINMHETLLGLETWSSCRATSTARPQIQIPGQPKFIWVIMAPKHV
jgi:hypothetical protein